MTLQQLRYALTIAGCGSMNEAAKRLFLSQPSLSETVKELEQEIGLQIFMRSNRGIIITPEGEEFLGYARQVIDQYGILKARYVEKQRKEKFSVSMQHYTFAVKAFVETVKKAGMDSYEFAANETTTYDVMENVRNFKSTYDYKRLIKANDRATLLNFMIGLNAYTLCSGIICEELNGSDYMAIPLKETEKMRIGYVKRKGASISHIGQIYIEELKKYKEKIM